MTTMPVRLWIVELNKRYGFKMTRKSVRIWNPIVLHRMTRILLTRKKKINTAFLETIISKISVWWQKVFRKQRFFSTRITVISVIFFLIVIEMPKWPLNGNSIMQKKSSNFKPFLLQLFTLVNKNDFIFNLYVKLVVH